MTNSTNNIGADISTNSQKLEKVTSFRYLGAVLGKDSTCSADISNGQIKQDMTEQTISFASKLKLYMSPPFSFMAVKHEPCLLRDPGFRNPAPEETSPNLLLGAQGQRLGSEQDQLFRGFTGTSSSYRQETETCMVQSCHTPPQPLQNHPSWYLGGSATP